MKELDDDIPWSAARGVFCGVKPSIAWHHIMQESILCLEPIWSDFLLPNNSNGKNNHFWSNSSFAVVRRVHSKLCLEHFQFIWHPDIIKQTFDECYYPFLKNLIYICAYTQKFAHNFMWIIGSWWNTTMNDHFRLIIHETYILQNPPNEAIFLSNELLKTTSWGKLKLLQM